MAGTWGGSYSRPGAAEPPLYGLDPSHSLLSGNTYAAGSEYPAHLLSLLQQQLGHQQSGLRGQQHQLVSEALSGGGLPPYYPLDRTGPLGLGGFPGRGAAPQQHSPARFDPSTRHLEDSLYGGMAHGPLESLGEYQALRAQGRPSSSSKPAQPHGRPSSRARSPDSHGEDDGSGSEADGKGTTSSRGRSHEGSHTSTRSAQRSRIRKMQHVSDLQTTVARLQSEVSSLSPQVAFLRQKLAGLVSHHQTLQHELANVHNEAVQKSHLNKQLRHALEHRGAPGPGSRTAGDMSVPNTL